MRRILSAFLLLTAPVLLVSCEDDPQDSTSVPATLAALSALSQAGTVGAAVAQTPRVVVRDADGDPVEGVAVTFAVTQGGGSIAAASATTDANGAAAAGGWTLGQQPGVNRVTATVTGLAVVTFEAVAAAGPPAALELASGNAQSGVVGQPLGALVVVRVRDAFGNAVGGAGVQFAVLGGGGQITASAVSDPEGRAAAAWTLGLAAGAQSARASLPGTTGSVVAVDFTASAAAGTPASLTILSGDGQTGPAGAALPQPIRVTVRDAFGNAVGAGVRVFFTASQGGSVASAEAVTDGAGAAGTGWTLRNTAGMNGATARLASGAAVVFTANGLAGVPARMVAVSGDGQSGGPGAQLAPLVVQLLDADANPVGAGFTIQFSTVDGSVSPASAVTDANGQASTLWRLGLILGATSVRAALAGKPSVFVDFDATVVAGAPTTIAIVSGNNQSALPGAALAAPLVVLVTDAASNPVAGATVDFAVTAGGGSVTPLSVTTNAAGMAGTAWTLGATGAQTATATLNGVPGQVVTFTATLSIGPPATITVVSGDAQMGNAGAALPAAVVVLVQDAANNPVPGVTVNFAATSGGGSFSPASPTTNALGQVSGTWTLGVFPGPNGGSATVSGMPAVTVNVTATGDAPPFAMLALGSHSCGIASVLYCWGPNAFGELGDGTTTDRSQPTLVSGGLVFGTVSVGNEMSCGIAAGVTYCWGYNGAGQIGDGTTTNRSAPTPVSGGPAFTMIDAGGRHACGILAGGQAWCWGQNIDGKLGDGTTTDRSVPTAVTGGVSFAFIAAGPTHSCGLTSAGAAWCWGGNASGQLGDGTTTPRSQPTAVTGGLTFAYLSIGALHTCGLTTGGVAWCWGENGLGQVGDGTTTDRTAPTAVSGGLTFGSLESGQNHNCGLVGATAWCWGGNGSGQLGDGTTTTRTAPVTVSGGLSFSTLVTGFFHTCGTAGSGTWCWGSNFSGRLGDGNPGVNSSVPVAVILP